MTCTAAFPLTLIQTLIAITFNLKCDKKILYIPIRRLTFFWWRLNSKCRERRTNTSRLPKNPKLHLKKKYSKAREDFSIFLLDFLLSKIFFPSNLLLCCNVALPNFKPFPSICNHHLNLYRH